MMVCSKMPMNKVHFLPLVKEFESTSDIIKTGDDKKLGAGKSIVYKLYFI